MFRGTGTAIITPFNEDTTIDYKSFEKLIDYQIENGIKALIILGTTGEAPVINDDERNELVDFVVNYVNKKVLVIVGTGTNDPHHVNKHNNNAEKYGADGVLIVNPYYNKGTQNSLVKHYKFLNDNTGLPIILYNVPSRTGMNMLPETIVKIADVCDKVVAVKEACGNISQIAKLMAIKPKYLNVLSGNDDQTLPILALGGSGVVSAWANAFPKEMSSLVNFILNGDYRSAQDLQNKYVINMQQIFNETSPTPIKYLVSKMGLCKNVLRLPLDKANETTMNILDEEFSKFQKHEILLSKIMSN
jgi:4-hydroxy-tetrahydrodipicolinate synthase